MVFLQHRENDIHIMLSENRNFFYLIQDIAGEESSECATRKRKAQSVSAITCWRKLSIMSRGNIYIPYNVTAMLCTYDLVTVEYQVHHCRPAAALVEHCRER